MRDQNGGRYLHQRSEYGYTASHHEAMRDEGEAVSEAEQKRLTDQARRVERQRRAERWQRTERLIVLALHRFADPATLRSDPALDGLIQGVRHRLRQVDKRVGSPR